MKVCVWMNMPSHHQRSFFEALIECGADVQVRYFGRVSEYRMRLGWESEPCLDSFEAYIDPSLAVSDVLASVTDWHERVHVVIGYGWHFLRKLVYELITSNTQWVHWSEPAKPGLRWWRSAPLKVLYAWCVNRYGLGAFAIGELAIADFQRWGIRKNKIALLPYSIPAPSVQANRGVREPHRDGNKRTFLYVGEMRRQKGFDLLIRAFARALDGMHSRDEWMLAFVGLDHTDGESKRLIEMLSLERRVKLLGAVPYGDVGVYMNAADVLVLPSRFDGWGAVVAEGAALGKALIASSMVGAAWHLIVPERNGFRPKAGNIDELTESLLRYMKDPMLAEAHGKESLVIYKEFTPMKNAKRFLGALGQWGVSGADSLQVQVTDVCGEMGRTNT